MPSLLDIINVQHGICSVLVKFFAGTTAWNNMLLAAQTSAMIQ